MFDISHEGFIKLKDLEQVLKWFILLLVFNKL